MNPYKVLGIKKNASKEEINEAYKKLAKIHHPDIGGDEDEFKKINEAKSILLDVEKRKFYDLNGIVPDSKSALMYEDVKKMMKDHILGRLSQDKEVSIELMKKTIKDEIKKYEDELFSLKEFLEILNENKNAIKKIDKRKKINCFRLAIQELIRETKDSIRSCRHNIDEGEKILEILLGYEDSKKRYPTKRRAHNMKEDTRDKFSGMIQFIAEL